MATMMSENERLDHQLTYGTDYVNLPAHVFPKDQAPTWIPQQEPVEKTSTKSREIRYLHHIRPATAVSQISQEHYANHQQMDAQNRLEHLEMIRPKENLTLLNVKFRNLQHPRHARPILPQYRDDYVNTFYNQTGAYVQERSGLYHTDSYEPNALAQAIPELENYQENASTSNDNDQLGDKTRLQLFQEKAIGDYQNMRNRLLNKLHVPHDASTVDSRTQEGEKQFVQCQSVYGQSYNTPKFLQDNTLVSHARVDPSCLMSTRYNHNLGRVRSLSSYPIRISENQSANDKQGKTDHSLVSPVLHPPINDPIYTTKSITEHSNGYLSRSTARVYHSPFKNEYDKSINQFVQQPIQAQNVPFNRNLIIPAPLSRSVKTSISLPGPEVVARFLQPTLEPKTTYQRTYKDIIYQEAKPSSKYIMQRSMTSLDHHSKRLTLADIQEGWSKTQALQQYHKEYPEPVPDVGGITIRARKEILIADTIAKKGELTIR